MSTPALSSYMAQLPTTGGRFSVWAGPVDGPAAFAYSADEQHYAASTMKVALVLAAYRRADAGDLDLHSTVTIHNDFASAVPGRRFAMDETEDSDTQAWARMGQQVALRWLASRAIVRSGNLATNLLLEAVGYDAVAATLDAVGAQHSVVTRGIEDLPARDAGHSNLVTAADLAVTLQALANETAAAPASCREILATLAAQQINDALPAGLPPGVKVAHKSGWVDGISHDAGIVYPPDSAPYILAVCTTSDLPEEQGLRMIAEIAAASWQDRHRLG